MFTIKFWKNLLFFYKFVHKRGFLKALLTKDGDKDFDRASVACVDASDVNHAGGLILGNIPDVIANTNPKVKLAKEAGGFMGDISPFFDAACPYVKDLKHLRKLIPTFLKKAYAIAMKVYNVYNKYLKWKNPYYLAYRAGKAVYDAATAKRKEKKAREITASIKGYIRGVMEGMEFIHEYNRRMERALGGHYFRSVNYQRHLRKYPVKRRNAVYTMWYPGNTWWRQTNWFTNWIRSGDYVRAMVKGNAGKEEYNKAIKYCERYHKIADEADHPLMTWPGKYQPVNRAEWALEQGHWAAEKHCPKLNYLRDKIDEVKKNFFEADQFYRYVDFGKVMYESALRIEDRKTKIIKKYLPKFREYIWRASDDYFAYTDHHINRLKYEIVRQWSTSDPWYGPIVKLDRIMQNNLFKDMKARTVWDA